MEVRVACPGITADEEVVAFVGEAITSLDEPSSEDMTFSGLVLLDMRCFALLIFSMGWIKGKCI